MSDYTELLGQVSPSSAGVRRAADIIAALAPPAADDQALAKTDSPSATKLAAGWLPGLAGAGVGAYMFRKSHPLLGAVGGHAIASTVMPIMRGGADRKRALCQLGVEGAAIAGALYFKNSPLLGFLGGLAVGAAVTAMIPGSATNELYKKLAGK